MSSLTFLNFLSIKCIHINNQINCSPLICEIHDITTSLLVWLHRDEGVTIIAIEIGESHSSIHYQGFLPQSLRPLREPNIITNINLKGKHFHPTAFYRVLRMKLSDGKFGGTHVATWVFTYSGTFFWFRLLVKIKVSYPLVELSKFCVQLESLLSAM